MPELDTAPFRPSTNIDILNAIRNGSSMTYQERIPDADKGNIDRVISSMMDYEPTRNEFLDNLVNLIGLQIVKSQVWSNPYSIFKRGLLEYGDTIEEIQVGLIKARTYNPDRESLEQDLFGQHRPDIQTSYHKINRQDKYIISVNQMLLQRAFQSEYGLSNLITGIMSAPTTSDNVDEYKIMAHLFAEYEQNGGYFKVHTPDLSQDDSTSDDARFLLKKIRGLAGNLRFVDTKYNAAGMPVFARPDELVLFTTPEVNAALDVDALSAAFQIDRAKVDSRIVMIKAEDTGIPGFQAVLSTNDFFVVADTYLNTTSQFNPSGLHTNYFLHHHGIYSVSRFAPAILFTTDDGTAINITDYVVTAVAAPTLTDVDGNAATAVERGGIYQVNSVVTTNPAGGPNDALIYSLTGNTSNLTYVTPYGVLHVALDEGAGSQLVVGVRSEDNPNYTNNATFAVHGEQAILWPNPEILPDADDDGLLEVIPEEPDFTDNVITIPSVVGVQYKNGATNLNNGSTVNVASGTPVTITAVARANYELASGATASWTFTYVA